MYNMLTWQITITVFNLFVNSSRNIKDIILISNLFILFVYQSESNTQ